MIRQYKGEQPLAAHLKTFFASGRKYGSNDRRQIGQMCYCYYRLGKLTWNCSLPVQDLIIAGLFLCTSGESELLRTLKPEWHSFLNESADAKLQLINRCHKNSNIDLTAGNIFPWHDLLSEGVDPDAFCRSFLVQPDVFLRIRPGFEKPVRQKLQNAGIPFRDTDKGDCIALNSLTRMEEVIVLNKEAVVQDYNSQRVFYAVSKIAAQQLNVWDCCAASGGKSILAFDVLGRVNLTVSDIRPSILANLRKRLATAGISLQQMLQLDLTQKQPLSSLALSPFDLVICDAPCSGSGTWSRTPEPVHFFDRQQVEHYRQLQQKIVTNVTPHVKPGGYLLYITCSAFKAENEMMADYLLKNEPFSLVEMKLLEGYFRKADTMFTALFRKK
ncbi:MAG: Fmu (Sun) domain-containing protein [Chitinophagaceae bacterium]|nr:Fmu (Sun) domain-containing protein [Chitinophagaceae bacterium]